MNTNMLTVNEIVAATDVAALEENLKLILDKIYAQECTQQELVYRGAYAEIKKLVRDEHERLLFLKASTLHFLSMFLSRQNDPNAQEVYSQSQDYWREMKDYVDRRFSEYVNKIKLEHLCSVDA